MISDLITYSNINLIVENSLDRPIGWHEQDVKMLATAVAYTAGIGRDYISLVDFILYFFMSNGVHTLLLTEDYMMHSPMKENLMTLLFFKDIFIIILSITAGDYSAMPGWSGVGFFWLRTIGKLSIILSLQKIFLVRLYYFYRFSV